MRVRNVLIFVGLCQDKRRVTQAAYSICVIDTIGGKTEFTGIDCGRYTRIRLKALCKELRRLQREGMDPGEHMRVIFTTGDQELHNIWHNEDSFRAAKSVAIFHKRLDTLKDKDLWLEIHNLSEQLQADIVFPRAESYMGAMVPGMTESARKYLDSMAPVRSQGASCSTRRLG